MKGVLKTFGMVPDAPPVIPAPAVTSPPVMPTLPTADLEKQQEQRRRTLAAMHARRGRASTIMSDAFTGTETLG